MHETLQTSLSHSEIVMHSCIVMKVTFQNIYHFSTKSTITQICNKMIQGYCILVHPVTHQKSAMYLKFEVKRLTGKGNINMNIKQITIMWLNSSTSCGLV